MFLGASFRVEDGERAAIVGPNGAGKTTLLRVVAGLQASESGEVRMPRDSEIGYLPQHLELDSERTLFEECRQVFAESMAHEAEMREIEQRMSEEAAQHDSPAYQRMTDRYGHLLHELQRRDYHTMDAQIGRILAGLGFKNSEYDRPCTAFSGGWQMRIAIARILLQNPDILLLDEPTNHLDIETIEWLANWIAAHEGSVLMVSHERAFMDRLCTKMVALEGGGRVVVYRGNYTRSLQARAERHEQMRRAFENQQQEIAQIQRFIDRFRYQASKATLVQSRVKALERIERLEPPPRDELQTISIRFPQPERTAKEVVRAEGIWKSYGDNIVLRGVDFSLYRGEKVALVGVNGAGKTTLMRLIAGRDTPTSGTVEFGGGVVFEYFAQYDHDDLSPERTVLNEFYSAAPLGVSCDARSILGAFLFEGDDVDKPVRVLSGGERTRLRLAKMLCGKSNLLLLDEPTNHLDIGSRLTLERAVKDYEGTVVFVSHDRYFLDSVPTRVVEISDGRLRSFPGNYEDYLRMAAIARNPQEQAAAPPLESGPAWMAGGAEKANRPESTDRSDRTDRPAGADRAGKSSGAAGNLSLESNGPAPKVSAQSHEARRAAEQERLLAIADEISSMPRKLSKDERKRVQRERQEWSRRLAKAERRVSEAEKAIAEVERRISELDRNMNRQEIASNSGRLMELTAEQQSFRVQLPPLYEEWEKAQDWLEQVKSELPEE